MQERRGVEEIEEKMRELEEKHERDKEEIKEELVATHMQKFREVGYYLGMSIRRKLIIRNC